MRLTAALTDFAMPIQLLKPLVKGCLRLIRTNFKSTKRIAVYREGVSRIIDAPIVTIWIVAMAEDASRSLWAVSANVEPVIRRFRTGQPRRLNAGRNVHAWIVPDG